MVHVHECICNGDPIDVVPADEYQARVDKFSAEHLETYNALLRAKNRLKAHNSAWDALVEHLDYAGEQYEHSDIVAMIAKLRPSAEE